MGLENVVLPDGTVVPVGGSNVTIYEEILTEAVSYASIPLSKFIGCNNFFCQLYIPTIAEETYSNCIPRIKLASSDVWSVGNIVAKGGISANTNHFICVGSFVKTENKAYSNLTSVIASQYAKATLQNNVADWVNTSNLNSKLPYVLLNENSSIYFEIYNRTYLLPAESVITVIGF